MYLPAKSDAIKNFLIAKTLPDLANLYNINLEVQVNVAQDGGSRIDGDFRGREWHGWTDGVSTWKPFRIPYKASTEPEYTDSSMSFDLAEHVEGIGMTGWDWKNQCSKWVGFDFDDITGHSQKHSKGLTPQQLEEVKKAVENIPWVSIRKSTSGRGLHLYIFLNDVPTKNHNEHAALARAILGKLSALTGTDFCSTVDVCGSNLWVWHRKMTGTDGLTLLKSSIPLDDIPINWQDHIKVVTGKRSKTIPASISGTNVEDSYDELMGQVARVPLDDEHKKFITYLEDSKSIWWFDTDHHILVTHTLTLKKAHTDLCLKGFYDTTSRGSTDYNCFLSPMRKGAWSVRRYAPGVQEHESWEQDGSGWTRCFFNKEPDLRAACRALGGLEDPSGGFMFREAEVATRAAGYLGISFKVDSALNSRKTYIKQHRDGRVIVEVDWDANDSADKMPGWLAKKNKWIRIFNNQSNSTQEPETKSYDDICRHLITEQHEDYGWMVKSEGSWIQEPLAHVKIALSSLGMNPNELTNVLGGAIFRCWKIVNYPFKPEYPGDRTWNRNAARLKFTPTSDSDFLKYPTWMKILQHCGAGLDDAIKNNPWARVNGILSGADYLKCWIASMFQEPTEPLPYLFFYGPQNSGKSIFHEALSLLFTKGYKRADTALTNTGGFNGELEGVVLCIIEETDLRKNKMAYNLIKDWVTAREISIHYKHQTPYHTVNTTHWVQCSNEISACPIFMGDTRIVMTYVDMLDPLALIPKKQLIPMLEKEAPDFLAEIMRLEIPKSNDRLNVPIISTDDKVAAQESSRNDLERYLADKCMYVPGCTIKFSDFYDKFVEWLEPDEIRKWSKIIVGREMPMPYVKGRLHKDGHHYIGNIKWANQETPEIASSAKLILRDGFLESQDVATPTVALIGA